MAERRPRGAHPCRSRLLCHRDDREWNASESHRQGAGVPGRRSAVTDLAARGRASNRTSSDALRGRLTGCMPFAERRVRVNAVDLSYMEAGSGRAVVLLHGNALTNRSWRGQLPLASCRGPTSSARLGRSRYRSCHWISLSCESPGNMARPVAMRDGAAQTGVVIGVDVGGTFTDLIALRGARRSVRKTPSRPD